MTSKKRKPQAWRRADYRIKCGKVSGVRAEPSYMEADLPNFDQLFGPSFDRWVERLDAEIAAVEADLQTHTRGHRSQNGSPPLQPDAVLVRGVWVKLI